MYVVILYYMTHMMRKVLFKPILLRIDVSVFTLIPIYCLWSVAHSLVTIKKTNLDSHGPIKVLKISFFSLLNSSKN